MHQDSLHHSTTEPLADYRQHYGLASDPFSNDPEFPFFSGGQRRQLLEQLLHLCQFSASLLAVLGQAGVGKTRLSQALLQAFSNEQDICQLQALPGASAEQVLGEIAGAFGIYPQGVPTQGQLLASLRRFGQAADELDSLALVVIDDAQHLDEQTLGGLLSLLQGQELGGRRLHIVLFGLPVLAGRLDKFGMPDVLVNDFYLDSFNLGDATDYLNFRMEMADYLGPELFTEALVEPWWRRAEGDLNQLHAQAHQWLLESVSQPAAPSARRGLPVMHIVAISALLAVLMLALLYRSGEAPSEPQPLVLEPRPRVAPSEPPVVPDVAPEPVPSVPTEPLPALTQPEVSPSLPAEPREPPPPPVAAIPPQPATPPQPAAPAPAPAPSATAPAPARAEIPEQEQVLLSWRASDYTLQLLGAGSLQAVRDYIARQPNREQLLMFQTERQGRPWYVVVVGRYPSADAARAAIAGLPAEQRQAGPWARSLAGVQGEIEKLRGL